MNIDKKVDTRQRPQNYQDSIVRKSMEKKNYSLERVYDLDEANYFVADEVPSDDK